MKNIGFLICSQGHALHRALKITQPPVEQVHIVSTYKQKSHVSLSGMVHSFKVIEWVNKSRSSLQLNEHFNKMNVGKICLLFNRLIDVESFDPEVFNIHPSMLPSFSGLYPLGQQLINSPCFQGATLHLIDDGIDTGPIVSQVVIPIDRKLASDISARKHYAFVLKVILLCEYIDRFLFCVDEYSYAIFDNLIISNCCLRKDTIIALHNFIKLSLA